MHDAPVITPIPPPQRRRRWRVPGWMVAVLVLTVAGYLYWLRLPKPMQEVGRYTVAGSTLMPCTSGFVYQPAKNTYAVRRWDGRAGWQVTVAPDALARISPDGRVFAAAHLTRDGVQVRIWREGTLIGEHHVPNSLGSPKATDISLKVLTDGRVVVTTHEYAATAKTRPRTQRQTLVLQGNRVVARGALPAEYALAPDGSVAVWSDPKIGYRYAGVTIANGALTLGTSYPITEPLELWTYGSDVTDIYPPLYSDGVVLSEEVTVYRTDGTHRRGARGWLHDTTISPSGRYTLLLQDDGARAYAPATGEHWEMHCPNNGGDITDDGRFVMLICEPPSTRLTQLAELVHLPMDDTLLAIYERPGRVCATLEYNPMASSWWMSPDGRAIVVLEDVNLTGEAEIYECVLYRW